MASSKGLLSNLSWKFAERIAAQMVTFVISIILARLLDPAHYGIISIVTIFITIANVFVSDGFGSALIQKKDADALDYSSVLYFNVAFSVLLYIGLFFAAPYIAAFYGEGYEMLTPVFRALGLRLIPAAINSVQNAYISKKMIFKKFFWATLFGTVISGVVGICMAYSGFGVWALVAQYLTNTTISTIVLCVILKKKPLIKFSFTRLKSLFKFGSKILCTGLLITCYQELRAIIIGKLYSSNDLAYYEKGRQFPNLLVTNINTSVTAVLFPKMANEQEDTAAVKNTTRISIRFGSYVLCPLMLGLAAVAESVISLLLTDKWLPCVPLMQLFCVVYLFQPVHGANMQAIKAIGRGDVYLKLEIVKKVIELIVLLCVFWISVEAIVIGMAVLTTLFTVVNAYPNVKLLNYSFKEQMEDILPSLLMSIIMMVAVYCIGFINMPTVISLVIQVVAGILIYLILSVCTKNKEFRIIKQMCISVLKGKNG